MEVIAPRQNNPRSVHAHHVNFISLRIESIRSQSRWWLRSEGFCFRVLDN